jgi:hypothetical protein
MARVGVSIFSLGDCCAMALAYHVALEWAGIWAAVALIPLYFTTEKALASLHASTVRLARRGASTHT